MESSVKSISRPVIDRLPVTSLEEFACRQLDRVRSVFPVLSLLFPLFVYLFVLCHVLFQFNLVLMLSFALIVVLAWALQHGNEATIKRRYR
jgi:hypothetical protein